VNGDGARRDVVAIIVAIGLATAVNVLTAAVLYDAIFSAGPGLSENATQILTGAFGGMIGLLGSFVGYRAGAASNIGRGDPTSGVAKPELPPDG
jgi:hypothetical protein